MGRFDGKVLLVAGGGADGPPAPGEKLAMGNGRATALLAARDGATVMVADRSLKLAQETVDAIAAEGGRAAAVEFDATQEQQCRNAVEAAVKSFGAIHLLVNNVGNNIGGSLLKTTVEQLDLAYSLNLRSHFILMQQAVPEMIKAGGGAIVNVSSTSALLTANYIAYESTKAGLVALTRSVGVNYARDGIRANCVLPGRINSTMARRRYGDREAQVANQIPMGRQGTPWEVAKTILFLLSDDASYITGTYITVAGGRGETGGPQARQVGN
jgi:NAD(P)-dependent dehydrogenase (short-subunit alcohol dehydrogenase family)